MAAQNDREPIYLDRQRAEQIAQHANHPFMPELPLPPGQLPPAGPMRSPQPVGGLSQPGAYRLPNQGSKTPAGAYLAPYGDVLVPAAPENTNLAAPAGVQWKKAMPAMPQPEAMLGMMALRPMQQVLPGKDRAGTPMPGYNLEAALPPAENAFVSPELQKQAWQSIPRRPDTGAPASAVVPPPAPATPPELPGSWRPMMQPTVVSQSFEIVGRDQAQPIRRQAGVDRPQVTGRPPAGKRLA